MDVVAIPKERRSQHSAVTGVSINILVNDLNPGLQSSVGLQSRQAESPERKDKDGGLPLGFGLR